VEDKIGQPLSPYAASKAMNEIYASAFARAFGFDSIGLRYFNVFGPRQDPHGAYAAVIPQWIAALIRRSEVYVNGDGETSRDFCFIENVVQANLLAAMTSSSEAVNQVYNIGLGRKTTLNELYQMLNSALRDQLASAPEPKLTYRDFRPGDVRHSLADIGKARRLLGYSQTQSVEQGLELAIDWYRRHLS
jgi:UDP-N-acetylglucosamine 4-epimerase